MHHQVEWGLHLDLLFVKSYYYYYLTMEPISEVDKYYYSGHALGYSEMTIGQNALRKKFNNSISSK